MPHYNCRKAKMSEVVLSLNCVLDSASWPVRVIYNSLRLCQNGESNCNDEIVRICQTLGGSVEYISKSPVTKKAKAIAIIDSGVTNAKQIARMAGCDVKWARKVKRAVYACKGA